MCRVRACVTAVTCARVCADVRVYALAGGFNLDRQNCLCAVFYCFTFIMMEVWYNLDLI